VTHFNPIGWGYLDAPDALTACGKRVAVVGWTSNPDNATCKKCKRALSSTSSVEGIATKAD
jgi:hypothetical protein